MSPNARASPISCSEAPISKGKRAGRLEPDKRVVHFEAMNIDCRIDQGGLELLDIPSPASAHQILDVGRPRAVGAAPMQDEEAMDVMSSHSELGSAN